MTAEISSSLAAPITRPAPNLTTQGAASVLRANDTTAKAPVVQPPPHPQIQFDASKMREELKAAIDLLNTQASKSKIGLGFSMDEALGRPVVTVRNTESGEIVRQIPNEVVVKVAHNIESFKGLLHNGTA